VKKYIYPFVLLLFLSTLYSQPRKEHLQSGPKPIYVEAHTVLNDSLIRYYVTYKVPYSNLVFIKVDNEFISGIIFRVEATTQKGVIARESTHDKVRVNNYEETLNHNRFLEGILSFDIKNTQATINSLIVLDNTSRQIPLRPFVAEKSKIQPIVVQKNSSCNNSIGYSLVNFENSIPFDDRKYQLVLPVFNKEIDEIIASISQNGDNITLKNLSKISNTPIGFDKCEDEIFLINESLNSTASIFVLDEFSSMLNEGIAEIKIHSSKDSLLYEGELLVNWVNKPQSLSNAKTAYQLLDLIAEEDNLDEIYKKAGNDYQQALDMFWYEYDPEPRTAFNQLKHEFYSRADKAIRKYGAKGKKLSGLTDRGKIYIKYGEPAEVDRYYSEKNEITEIWKYISPGIQFVFVDVSGLGNYKLVK